MASIAASAAAPALGYRWLTENKSWIYGVNAGIDNRPFQAQNFLQAGVGLEALSPNLEFRVNGYIPFSQTSNLYSTAYNGAYGLVNDQLQLNRSRWFGVALGGIDAEVGTPVARWQGGDLRLYAGYYYLDGDYVSGSSGVRARAELTARGQAQRWWHSFIRRHFPNPSHGLRSPRFQPSAETSWKNY
ncbi:inverse autotransporter beta domain-containing protein [Synechococcus sp.]|uniref:inverse autotransporter beta domain-containing protein n=1 Tax=Synechococcus sp. TaxID=1131 RepID=UPI0034A586D3